MNDLVRLHAEIDARVQSIRAARPDWLCAKGCDTCCRQLASIPQLSAAEWTMLQEGLAALPTAQQETIYQRIEALGVATTPPVLCPLLDPLTGACPVYVHRPVACRTYGFYVQRDKGLYCRDIESRVVDGALDDIVWGNHDVVDRQLAESGESRALNEWFKASE